MRVLLMIINLLIALLGIGAAGLAASLRIIKQYERGLIFRFGRVLDKTRGPGLAMIIPVADRLRKVNMQIVTMPVPAQEGITRDNVTVRVDAVVYFNVQDPVRAIVNVQDYLFAVLQVAAEKNSTVVLPFPVELLRFLEKATTGQSPAQAQTPSQGQAASQPGPPAPAQPESPPPVAEVAAGAEPVPQLPAGDGIRAIEPSSTPSTTIN